MPYHRESTRVLFDIHIMFPTYSIKIEITMKNGVGVWFIHPRKATWHLKINGWKMIHFLYTNGPFFGSKFLHFRECTLQRTKRESRRIIFKLNLLYSGDMLVKPPGGYT